MSFMMEPSGERANDAEREAPAGTRHDRSGGRSDPSSAKRSFGSLDGLRSGNASLCPWPSLLLDRYEQESVRRETCGRLRVRNEPALYMDEELAIRLCRKTACSYRRGCSAEIRGCQDPEAGAFPVGVATVQP